MRVGIVGAGIIGLAVARQLAEQVPGADVTVLEKERAPGLHQTGHNSGVAHAGLYYLPGSLKARLCRRGIGLLKAFCLEHDVAYEECGKLVIARDASELQRLDEIERRARENGVPGLRRLSERELTEVEPHARGVSALHSPSTAVLDFKAVADALAQALIDAGGQVRVHFAVTGIQREHRETRLTSAHGEELAFDLVVLCAGLQSDRLARVAGDPPEPGIVPFRGEYYRLVAECSHWVRGLIYPVPDPAYPFLGVHFTRRIDGTVDIGPNAVLALAREGYRRRDVSIPDLRELVGSPGFRRLLARHWRRGVREIGGSLSRRAFIAQARTYVPELTVKDVEPAGAGVRAQAVNPDGSLVDDFRISHRPGIVMVRNAPSPAATSSLAIAEYVVEQLASAPAARGGPR